MSEYEQLLISSCPDWVIDFQLEPSLVGRLLLGIVLVLSLLVLSRLDLPFYVLLILVILQTLLLINCIKRFISLTHTDAIKRISLRNDVWILQSNKGFEHHTKLTSMLLSRNIIVLGLSNNAEQATTRLKYFPFWTSRYMQIIFADQLSEKSFKKLFMYLKFGGG